MAKAVSQLLMRHGIYATKNPTPAAKAYVNEPSSRFAATKATAGAEYWEITHRRTGSAITSVCNVLATRKEALDIIAKFEASGLDFGPFDRLPEVTEQTNKPAEFPPEDLPLVRPLVDRLRQIARGAL